MTDEAPRVNTPTTAVPFLDVDAIADPGQDGVNTQNGSVNTPSVNTGESVNTVPRETSGEPCADCARYARLGYMAGAVVGITAGALVAYMILRNRLAPVGE